MTEVTQELLVKLIQYDAETGVITWKPRDGRSSATWNAKFAGKPAGSVGDRGYRCIKIGGRGYKAHRIIWLLVHGVWPNTIDHENGDRGDNRLSNLRDATRSQNNKNKRLHKNNKTGAPGISFVASRGKWRAVVYSDGRQKSIGMFASLDDAVAARLSGQSKYGFHENHGAAPKINHAQQGIGR